MIRFVLLVASAILSTVFSFAADAALKEVGDWIVTADRDRFDSRSTVLALLLNSSGSVAVRCLTNGLTIALVDRNASRRFQKLGDTYKIKFRVDSQPVLDLSGEAVTGELIQIDDVEKAVQQIAKGSEVAIRVTKGDRSADFVFPAKGASRAMAIVRDACPENDVGGDASSAKNETPDWLKVAIGRTGATQGISCMTTTAFKKQQDDKSELPFDEKNTKYGCDYQQDLVRITSTKLEKSNGVVAGRGDLVAVETLDQKWSGYTILDYLRPIPPVGTEMKVKYVGSTLPALLYPTKEAEEKSGLVLAAGTRVRLVAFEHKGDVSHQVEVLSGEHLKKTGWLMDIELTLPQGTPLEFVR